GGGASGLATQPAPTFGFGLMPSGPIFGDPTFGSAAGATLSRPPGPPGRFLCYWCPVCSHSTSRPSQRSPHQLSVSLGEQGCRPRVPGLSKLDEVALGEM